MKESVLVLVIAFGLDLILGDPVYRLHPVRLIGNWAALLEKNFFKHHLVQMHWGIVFWILTLIPVLTIYGMGIMVFSLENTGLLCSLWNAWVLYSCMAFRDMISHALPVWKMLQEGNLQMAGRHLSGIVGRDTENLDAGQIARAAIESISESFVDGYFAIIFWYLAGVQAAGFFGGNSVIWGLTGVLLYRTSNTLDSMVGYNTGEYKSFGKFSARTDDVLNLIPSRLSALVILPAVLILGKNLPGSIRIFMRDRLMSASPNAGHSMSLFAGALDIQLGGMVTYGGVDVQKPWIGDPVKKPDSKSLLQAIQIFSASGFLAFLGSILFCWIQ